MTFNFMHAYTNNLAKNGNHVTYLGYIFSFVFWKMTFTFCYLMVLKSQLEANPTGTLPQTNVIESIGMEIACLFTSSHEFYFVAFEPE